MSNVIIGAYYNSKNDPQRNIKVDTDSYNYIKGWYDSIMELNLKGVLLHDGSCSRSFIDKYSNENFTFVDKREYTPKEYRSKYILNVARFIDIKYYLKEHTFDKVFTTDVSDVTFKKNPFGLINNTFIIQHEQDMSGNPLIQQRNQWCRIRFPSLFNNTNVEYKHWDKPLLNCGVFGSSYSNIMFVLNKFHELAEVFNDIGDGIHDMPIINKIVYDNFLKEIRTGFPIHTIFKKYDINNPEAYIVHK